ncbi:hypothetical protein ACTS9T_03815 [Empedobacter falsenii]
MGVVRGKRSVKIKEKIKAVQIQSTANLFQGPVPANITLKAVPQGFTALNYKWYINAGTSIVGTNQTFIIANNQVETTNVYKVVVTSIDGEDFEATISIAKVKDGSAIVAIKRYKDEIEAQRNQLVASFNSLYNNPKIGNYKTTLRTNFTNYNTAYTALINVINTIVTNNNLTPTDEATLDSSIAEYKLKLTAFVESLEMALKLTTNYLDDTIDRINNITSFLNTTVNGNVIGTGVLMVGSESQSNAGISGLNEAGSKSVRLWAGGTAQNRDKARWQMLDNGTERGFHPNGNLAWERGFDTNGVPFYSMFNLDGLKTFHLDAQRGLVPVPYLPMSFTNTDVLYILKNKNVSDNELVNELKNKFGKRLDLNNSEYYYIYLSKTLTIYEFYNGSHPSNSHLAEYNGYKQINGDYTKNCANGWYGFELGDIGYGKIRETRFIYSLHYLENGIIAESRTFSILI